MKLTFVTPRYGLEIVGGAEYAIRMLAENCQEYGDVEAEVLTSTAGDERTWSKRYSEGTEDINGVAVKRFLNEKIDREDFDSWSQELLFNSQKVTENQFDNWLIKQGPYSPDLLQAVENCESDAIVFHPMLSSPSAHGILRAKKPVILHPALHNESLSYMPGYKKVVDRADLLAFSTRSEQRLSESIFSTFMNRQSVIGFGVDMPLIRDDNKNLILQKYGLKNKNYAIVIGRVDQAKGSDLIFEMFQSLQQSIDPVETLVFVGPRSSSSSVAETSNVKLTGVINDEEKWVLLKNARSLISPSVTESFSLVVLEAMAVGVPVLVNAACGPTVEHVKRARAGASYSDASTFIAGLNLVSENSNLRDEFVERSIAYIENYYSWEKIIPRYLETVLATIS